MQKAMQYFTSGRTTCDYCGSKRALSCWKRPPYYEEEIIICKKKICISNMSAETEARRKEDYKGLAHRLRAETFRSYNRIMEVLKENNYDYHKSFEILSKITMVASQNTETPLV